jgi:hypothetical protein
MVETPPGPRGSTESPREEGRLPEARLCEVCETREWDSVERGSGGTRRGSAGGEYLRAGRGCLKLARADARSSVDRVAGVATGEMFRMSTRR